jgi:hypothetical protein
MQTDLFKTLLFYAKGTMQVNQEVFNLLPLVDFSRSWNNELLREAFSINDDDLKTIDIVKS